MDPYEARPEGIPPHDLYKDLPLYGRYCPQPEDFVPEPKYCNSTTPEALHYWSTVLQKCDSRCYVYENPFGGRDVFALGSVIIKSRHLQLNRGDLGSESSRDYSITDANEIAAIRLASRVVTTPDIFFKGRVSYVLPSFPGRIANAVVARSVRMISWCSLVYLAWASMLLGHICRRTKRLLSKVKSETL